MRTTETHVRYWQQHSRPAWAHEVTLREVSVHECINARVEKQDRPAPYVQAGNLLSLLRMVRARGESLAPYLAALATPGSWCYYNIKRRYGYAVKWSRRLNG